MGKMIAMVLANAMPGQRAEPGRLSDIHELMSVKKIVRKLIYASGQ